MVGTLKKAVAFLERPVGEGGKLLKGKGIEKKRDEVKERISWKYAAWPKKITLFLSFAIFTAGIWILIRELIPLNESILLKSMKIGVVALVACAAILVIRWIFGRDADLVEMDTNFIYAHYQGRPSLQFRISDLIEVRTHPFKKPPRTITLIFRSAQEGVQKVRFYPVEPMSLEGAVVKRLKKLIF